MQLIHLAQYVANECQRYGKVTPMKLQKLLYYVKAWGLVAGTNLVPGGFQKWDYGPVNPEVYRTYKQYGKATIPYTPVPSDSIPKGKKRELTDFIATCYAQYNALTLSAMTHKEDPWRKTRKNCYISEGLMRNYYSQQTFAKNFPFHPDKGPFYPVESDIEHAFSMDMSEEEAKRVNTYESYRAYLRHIERASGEFTEHFSRLLT